jgi:hypothetical protein
MIRGREDGKRIRARATDDPRLQQMALMTERDAEMRESIEIKLGLDLFPRSGGFAGVPFDCGAKLQEVFHVFEAFPFLELAQFGGQGFESRFSEGGVTHRRPFGH